jgi:hypothetical protein
MRQKLTRGVMIVGLALGLAGCATGPEPEWMKKPYHFASFSHLGFSWRNQGEEHRVTRQDLTLAKAEGWHGDAVQVKASDVIVE